MVERFIPSVDNEYSSVDRLKKETEKKFNSPYTIRWRKMEIDTASRTEEKRFHSRFLAK